MGKRNRATPSRVAPRGADAKGGIVIGIPTRGECQSHFARTLTDMAYWDAVYGGRRLNATRPFIWSVGATQIVNARNNLVHQFLAQEHGEWLLMLDDDQIYPQHLLEYLTTAADPKERRIIGVPVWRLQSDAERSDDVRATHNVFDFHESGSFVEWSEPLPDNALVQVGAIGTGCMMVHRSFLEEMRDWSEANNVGRRWCWFRHNVWQPADLAEGEDLYFCRVASLMGEPVFAYTFTTLGHVKSIILNGAVAPGLMTI